MVHQALPNEAAVSAHVVGLDIGVWAVGASSDSLL